jgi:hypothetical protein
MWVQIGLGGAKGPARIIPRTPLGSPVLPGRHITSMVFNATAHQFRMGTRYVRFVILANYQQDDTYKLRFTDLKLEEVPSG